MTGLRVGLNLVWLGEGGAGLGRYAHELPPALLAVAPGVHQTLFVSRAAPRSLLDAPWAGEVEWGRCRSGSGAARRSPPR